MFTPAEIAKNYCSIGKTKTELPAGKMLVLGIFAGAFIALGGLASQVVAVSIPLPSIAKWAGACVFPIGLMMVLLAGSELFTGNCLLILPVLEKEASWKGMLKNWFFVYLGNFLGAMLIALMAAYSHSFSLFDQALAASVVQTASAKTGLTFSDAFLRGILCNILVCLAVWMSFAASDVIGKLGAVFFPVMAFVLCGFEHSVANMYFFPAGVFASRIYDFETSLSWGCFLLHNLLPVTLGNLVGGALLVGCGYWYVYLKKS